MNTSIHYTFKESVKYIKIEKYNAKMWVGWMGNLSDKF